MSDLVQETIFRRNWANSLLPELFIQWRSGKFPYCRTKKDLTYMTNVEAIRVTVRQIIADRSRLKNSEAVPVRCGDHMIKVKNVAWNFDADTKISPNSHGDDLLGVILDA
jgi:hypothetical protein